MVRYGTYQGTPTKRMRTKRKKKDMDEIYQDLTRAPDMRNISARKPDLDLPALGNFYCIACARYFGTQEILDQHCKAKPHKKRVKTLSKEVPYGIDQEEIYGKIDNGVKITEIVNNPLSEEASVTSVKQHFGDNLALASDVISVT